MLSRINKTGNSRNESGFTLIELLVVIIIIAILAAIAIPMYLRQREKSYRASMQSDLRNAAVAMESHYTDDATYVGGFGALGANGYNQTKHVNLASGGEDLNWYCLSATHDNLPGVTWHLGNRAGDSGAPEDGGC